MSRPPRVTRTGTGQKIEIALEKALDPFSAAIKRATRAPVPAGATEPVPAAGKPGLASYAAILPFGDWSAVINRPAADHPGGGATSIAGG